MIEMTRRRFMAAVSAGTFAAVSGVSANSGNAATVSKLAIDGGTPVRRKGFNGWPVWDRGDEKAVLDILRSGNWFRGRGSVVSEFEKQYAALTGAAW